MLRLFEIDNATGLKGHFYEHVIDSNKLLAATNLHRKSL